MMADARSPLRKLAELYDVQATYADMGGRRRSTRSESLLRVLAALGAPVQSPSDVPEAIRLRQREQWQRPCEPVVVAWDGTCPTIEIRLLESQSTGRLRAVLRPEAGPPQSFDYDLGALPTVGRTEADGIAYVAKQLSSLGTLPPGYHQLHMETGSRVADVLIISSPKKAYSPSPPAPLPKGEGRNKGQAARNWGVMAPLYAIHSDRSWGAGNLTDLASLWHWVAALGGRLVATLPLLAAYLDEPFDPSPYAPVSRLFWNEFYADLTEIPEVAECPAAQEILESGAFRQELGDLRRQKLIDYRPQMTIRRRVIEALAEHCFAEGGKQLDALRAFAARRPEIEDYARFRAVTDRLHLPWTQWPAPLCSGRIQPGDYDQRDYHYHLYAQWITERQLENLSMALRKEESRLYLDLPLGIHRHGFDTWRHPELFAFAVSGGAPPDMFFTQGQNWNFAPLRPDQIRAEGYCYVLASLRTHLRYAGMLRIDHIMGLHRLFWIPEGLPAKCGVYVRYPAEELYALLCLESHRHQAEIVGENLGTVPAYVNAAMRRHAIHRTYVVQYELNPRPRKPPLNAPEPHVVAALNTHDMAPFAAYWNGTDLDDLHALGLFDASDIAAEHARRRATRTALVKFLRTAGIPGGLDRLAPGDSPGAKGKGMKLEEESLEEVLAAVLRYLAASPAQHLLITLEDLWLETQRQNMPGTVDQHPNWRSKMRYPLEVIQQNPQFRKLLTEVNQLRRR
jgi:4-alpha-glucanotransferase